MTLPPGDFLRGVSRYLGSLEREPGVLYCRKHRIEHTGTGSYLALLESHRHAPGEGGEGLERAVRVARRVVQRTQVDPGESYVAWIVLPGSRDPHNHANNAIDCGCAVDALATLGRFHAPSLPAGVAGSVEESVRKIADTYLVPHGMPKEILAQRLWGAAALGSAHAWLGEPRWREAGLAAIERSFSQQNHDGSFPYTPIGTPRSHEGSADASSFYHSRPALFAAWALRGFGEDPAREPWGSHLRAACEFLLALRRADGTKTPFVEAKPWYWGSGYEVASFPFDVAMLLLCGQALGEARYLRAAASMYRLLCAHVEPDGGITSHRGPGWNFQCRHFWNSHCAWLARVEGLLTGALALPPEDPDPGLRWFPQAGLARYEDAGIVVIARGRRPRSNLNHGSPLGGGGLLHAAARRDAARELAGKRARDRFPAGEWVVVPRGAPGRLERLRKAWRENRDELRFSAWIARVRWRAGEPLGALRWLLDRWHLGIVVASRSGLSSAFATEVEGEAAASTLAFRGGVADCFGDALEGMRTIRRYSFERGSVRVGDALAVDRALAQCWYRLPPGAEEAAIDGAAARVSAGLVAFGPVAAGALLAIRYRIRAGPDR